MKKTFENFDSFDDEEWNVIKEDGTYVFLNDEFPPRIFMNRVVNGKDNYNEYNYIKKEKKVLIKKHIDDNEYIPVEDINDRYVEEYVNRVIDNLKESKDEKVNKLIEYAVNNYDVKDIRIFIKTLLKRIK